MKDLEDKGDQPITGTDITKFLDEMGEFMSAAQYAGEDGEFLIKLFHFYNLMRGNTDLFKFHINYTVLPKYYSLIPPRINLGLIWHEIQNGKLTELPNYFLAYQIYNRIRDEYLVSKGMKDPLALDKDLYKGFFDKFINKVNDTYFDLKMKKNMLTQGFPITPQVV